MPKEKFTATCRECGAVFTSVLSKEQALIMLDIHMQKEHR